MRAREGHRFLSSGRRFFPGLERLRSSGVYPEVTAWAFPANGNPIFLAHQMSTRNWFENGALRGARQGGFFSSRRRAALRSDAPLLAGKNFPIDGLASRALENPIEICPPVTPKTLARHFYSVSVRKV